MHTVYSIYQFAEGYKNEMQKDLQIAAETI